jgi:hypothetical protein
MISAEKAREKTLKRGMPTGVNVASTTLKSLGSATW